jgi:acyl-CoA thioester hydrolase
VDLLPLTSMKHSDLSEFHSVITIPLQWGDQDAFGHVNNTVYVRWCESSRVEYLTRVGLWMILPNGLGPILANISCDYRQPLTFPDTIHVGARVTRMGNSSFRMEHCIVSEALNAVAADAHSTVVVLDYKRNKSVRVPDAVRRAIQELDGRSLEHPEAD